MEKKITFDINCKLLSHIRLTVVENIYIHWVKKKSTYNIQINVFYVLTLNKKSDYFYFRHSFNILSYSSIKEYTLETFWIYFRRHYIQVNCKFKKFNVAKALLED